MRAVWKSSVLPTHSHGLRDGALFYLLLDKLGADTWVISAVCAVFLIVWIGEMISIGQEDQSVELKLRIEKE